MKLTRDQHAQAIDDLAAEAHECAVEKGWYDQERNIPELLMLVVSELSEALEVVRKDHGVEKFTEELADAVIRILDMARSLHLPIGEAILKKMAFNWNREHRHGGKKF